MKWKDSFHPYALTTILFWSLAFPITHLAMKHFSAYGLGLWRYAAASAALLPVVLIKKLRLPRLKDLGWFLLSGALEGLEALRREADKKAREESKLYATLGFLAGLSLAILLM